jgi:hypothetical protein
VACTVWTAYSDGVAGVAFSQTGPRLLSKTLSASGQEEPRNDHTEAEAPRGMAEVHPILSALRISFDLSHGWGMSYSTKLGAPQPTFMGLH